MYLLVRGPAAMANWPSASRITTHSTHQRSRNAPTDERGHGRGLARCAALRCFGQPVDARDMLVGLSELVAEGLLERGFDV